MQQHDIKHGEYPDERIPTQEHAHTDTHRVQRRVHLLHVPRDSGVERSRLHEHWQPRFGVVSVVGVDHRRTLLPQLANRLPMLLLDLLQLEAQRVPIGRDRLERRLLLDQRLGKGLETFLEVAGRGGRLTNGA